MDIEKELKVAPTIHRSTTVMTTQSTQGPCHQKRSKAPFNYRPPSAEKLMKNVLTTRSIKSQKQKLRRSLSRSNQRRNKN